MLRYTIVNTMKINACRTMIRIWKIDQPICNKPAGNSQPQPALNRAAIRINIISPAYMFPNSRKPRENGLASRPTTYMNKFTGINIQWLNGFMVSSLTNPKPLILME